MITILLKNSLLCFSYNIKYIWLSKLISIGSNHKTNFFGAGILLIFKKVLKNFIWL